MQPRDQQHLVNGRVVGSALRLPPKDQRWQAGRLPYNNDYRHSPFGPGRLACPAKHVNNAAVRIAASLLLVLLCGATAIAVPRGGPRYETDSRTVGFLRRYLVSGGDIYYPLEAARAEQSGSGFYFMKLRPDGSVESVTVKRSTGYKALDEHVTRTLQAYRFKPKTKGPLFWLVSFAQPATVIVKVSRVRDERDIPVLP